MAVISGQSVLSLFRGRVSDDTAVREAFSLRVTDAATEGYVQIISGQFSTNIVNSVNAANLQIDLTDSRFNTIQKLINYLNSKKSYLAQASAFIDQDFPSSELEIQDGNTDIVDEPITFYHRRFSNKELIDILDSSARMHNLNYTYETIPEEEVQLVFDLAHANALRRLAAETVKRVGLDIDSGGLLGLAETFEANYQEVITRQRRAIPVPQINDSRIGEGDIVSGHIYRPSLRTGRLASRNNANPPERPIIVEPKDLEIGDDYIAIKWVKPSDSHVLTMEIWRDITPNVKRVDARAKNIFTSKCIYSGGSYYCSHYYSGLVDSLIGSDCVYIDGIDNKDDPTILGLEPSTVYYYRIYFVNVNGIIIDSQSITCKTKVLRAKFALVEPKISVTHGPITGGTALTLKGVYFHTGMKVFIGDKAVTSLVIVNSTTATCVSPQVYNEKSKGQVLDVVLQSNTGLKDILTSYWTYDL